MKTEHNVPQKQGQKTITQGTAVVHNHIKHVVAVMSGKGGVGKSFVTGLLASGLKREGYAVGILDADITGPSIPLIFGVHGPVDVGEFGILPIESRTGIRIISMNVLLPQEDQPVIWRGPLVSQGIKQLWGDVLWGDLDYLLIDLPPGTSDATLTIMQSLPVNGLIMVTTPQSLSSMVVRKAVHMAQIVKVNIIGIIENMAYFECPDTGKQHFIFGQSHSEEVAAVADAPILARLPIDADISRLCDAGEVEAVMFEGLPALVDHFLDHFHCGSFGRDDVQIGDHPLDGSELSVEHQHHQDLSLYSPVAQGMIVSKENMGCLDMPDLRGRVKGCCGDSIQIDLQLEGDIIKDARYTTDGCYATMACGGIITHLIKGKTLAEAGTLEAETVISSLGGLPKGHVHCASLAVKTLRAAIENKGFLDEFSPSRTSGV